VRSLSAEPSSPAVVVRRIVGIGPPPWSRLALAVALGVAGAMATVGLLAGSGYVVDRAAFRPGLGAIAGLLAGVEVIAFLRGPLRYAERLVAHDVAFRSLSRWRVWLYDRLEPLAPAGLGGWRSGDLLARMTDDVDALQDLYLRCLLPVVVTVGAATLAVVLVATILPAAGAILGASVAAALLTAPVVAVTGSDGRGRVAALRGELSAEVVDLLRAAPELLAFGQDTAALVRLDAIDAELASLARRRAWIAGAGSAIVATCLGGAVTGVLAVGLAAVRAHHMGSVMLGVLPLAVVGAFETVPAVGLAAVRAVDVVAAGRRLLALDAIQVPVVDPPTPATLPAGCPDVVFSGARLRYADTLPWALDGLDLAVAPGERLGVVGPSGSGKSSLVNALVRFWPLQEGSVSLGGIDLETVRQADVRRTVSLVDQDAHIFGGSIRHNIALARPRAGTTSVDDAIAKAQLADWVATLPRGLDTQVGEGGTMLSGGQRHRIALARALLAGGPVLVLDEPTAGLDAEAGARLVTDVLEATSREGASVLLITHRERELAHFDRVVSMEAGRVRSASAPADPEAAR
jgi:thiol reductant ABC exporter CydC subunit